MDLSEFLLAWRTTALPDREVIDTLVHPAHTAPSPALAAALARWPGTYYWSDEPDGRHLVLTRATRPRPRERWLLHGALFITTLYTVTFAGAVLAGRLPYSGVLTFFTSGHPGYPAFVAAWSGGLAFSVPLLAILLCHELGHFGAARRYLLDVSPPYFIPVPLLPSFIGTMGAFIRLRTILTDRRQLFDVGVAGPIAGFVVALPALAAGVALSHPIASPHEGWTGMIVYFGADPYIPLGDSLITWTVRRLVLGDAPAIWVHPLAFAGWVGMFITMLNLLPISQLDGGHLLYAVLPRWHYRVAQIIWVAITALGYLWPPWLFWAVVVLLLSRGRLGHPPVLDAYRPLPRSRHWLAWAAVVLFVITFTPVPTRM